MSRKDIAGAHWAIGITLISDLQMHLFNFGIFLSFSARSDGESRNVMDIRKLSVKTGTFSRLAYL